MIGRFKRRSWGYYITLIEREHFKVKILYFKKGHHCSNQYHNYRSELWLFLKGYGKFNGKEVEAGEWQMINEQTLHQYTAYRKTWVLEIQYGEKCEESDIVRLI